MIFFSNQNIAISLDWIIKRQGEKKIFHFLLSPLFYNNIHISMNFSIFHTTLIAFSFPNWSNYPTATSTLFPQNATPYL